MKARAAYRRLLLAVSAGALLIAAQPASAQDAGSISLIGTVARNCTIIVTSTTSALNLDLSNGTRRVQVGSILQNCNRRAGYQLHVLSDNCGLDTAGAKLVGTVEGETLRYSVEFNNPTTGGSQATVTGLLANACSGASAVIGRDVTNSRIFGETSRVYVNYTGNSGLAADSYTDTLTVTMVVK